MKDLKYLQFFEELSFLAGNDLVRKAKDEGRVCVTYMCENTPEPLLNLSGCFGVRLTAPGTTSTDLATYYVTGFLCETARALLERSLEGGYNFANCLIAPDGCTMINRCAENMELLSAMKGEDNFFYEHHEVPLKADENGVKLLMVQCENHILKPLQEHFEIDVSKEAMVKAVAEHNEVCRLINELGEFRKDENPRITGYEFAVITLATYIAPKDQLIEKLKETLEEVKNRVPDEGRFRARVLVAGSEMEDVGFIKLVEECGAFVCADRFCFGSFPGRTPVEVEDGEDVLHAICRHYVMNCQCPRQMNMEKVYGRKEYISELAREFKADGIIYNQMKFCDPWAYERTLGAAMLREDFGYPVLSIDRPFNSNSVSGQLRTRVQAFIESMEIKNLAKEVR